MRVHVIASGSMPELAALMLPAVFPQATDVVFHALPADAKPRFWPFASNLDTLLNNIPNGEPVILADWSAAIAVPKRWMLSRECLHVATELPGQETRNHLNSYFKKPLQIHAASQTIADFLLAAGADKDLLHVTYPRFPIQPPAESSRPTFMIGTACELSPNQGLETVLQAMHDCRELLPQLKLVIIGDGPDKRRVLWLISQLDLRNRVQIAATTAEYQRFLTNFDIFIAPNPRDHGSNPMIGHALSRSIPVIATKLPSHEEWIQHGRTGLLYEPGNSTMLAQHILNLYNHPDWMAHYKNIGPEVLRSQ